MENYSWFWKEPEVGKRVASCSLVRGSGRFPFWWLEFSDVDFRVTVWEGLLSEDDSSILHRGWTVDETFVVDSF